MEFNFLRLIKDTLCFRLPQQQRNTMTRARSVRAMPGLRGPARSHDRGPERGGIRSDGLRASRAQRDRGGGVSIQQRQLSGGPGHVAAFGDFPQRHVVERAAGAHA